MLIEKAQPCRFTAKAVKARKNPCVGGQLRPTAALSGAAIAEIYARAGGRSPANSLEMFERRAATRRDAVSVGQQTMGDALAVRNVLAADHHGVIHARIVIVLGACRKDGELKRQADESEGGCILKLHGPVPISGK